MLDGPRDYRFNAPGIKLHLSSLQRKTNITLYIQFFKKEKRSSKDLNHYQYSFGTFIIFVIQIIPPLSNFFQADLPAKKPASISSILN